MSLSVVLLHDQGPQGHYSNRQTNDLRQGQVIWLEGG
jgi:hypothetical protein